MNPRQVDRFFQTLSKQLNEPVNVILTGAAAGSLWGHVRPSLDVDFAIRPMRRSSKRWMQVEEAVQRTIRLTGIQANYAEDIDRWGMISLIDYERHTQSYRRFGKIHVRLMDPAYWSIGKMTRYLDPDVQDLVQVFKRKKISPERLTRVWGQAIRKSPASTAIAQFRKHVENFLRVYGKTIWGAQFNRERTLARFYRYAIVTSGQR